MDSEDKNITEQTEIEQAEEDTKNIIELKEEFVVLSIPSSTVELTINVKIYNDGQIIDAYRKLSIEEVREAIEEAKKGYIPSDALYRITEEGERYLEELKSKENSDVN